MSEFQLHSGSKLYYEDTGSGHTVVMLHGWTSSHEIFTKPVKLLGDSWRLIRYDQRGHGGSRGLSGEPVTVDLLADDLNELLMGLSLTNITLLGWSMGASTVLTYIEKYGCDRLKQVVLCDMTPKKINDDTWKLGLYKGAYTAADSRMDLQKKCDVLFKEYALHTDPKLKNVPGLLLNAGLRKKMKGFDDAAVMSLFASMNEQDLRSNVAKITVPLTYFYSEPGSLYTPALAAWYGEQVNVPYKAVAFPNSTHLFISEYPEAFAAELKKLL